MLRYRYKNRIGRFAEIIMSDRDGTVDYDQWIRESAERQYHIFSRFGDREWDEIPKWELKQIRTKVSGYVFNKSYEELLETEEKKEKSAVDGAISKLKNASGDGGRLLLGCFYVDILLKKLGKACIIPILKTKVPEDDKVTFYELQSGRVYYGDSETYEKENKLPKCWMCYPQDGTYFQRGELRLRTLESPSCHSILPTVDVISLVGGGLCTAALAVSAFFPPLLALDAAVIAAGTGVISSGIYGMTRGAYELHDRDTHGQCCKLSDPEAFKQWLNVVLWGGSVLTASAAVIIKAASIGGASIVINGASRLKMAATVLRHLSVGVNGLGIVAIIVDLVFKFARNRLEMSDLCKVVSLCLLISNIVITTDQAEQVIRLIADQPQRMRNVFNMVRNTSSAVIKVVQENVTWAEVLDIITGDVAMNILRYIGFKRTADAVTSIRNRIRRCLQQPRVAVFANYALALLQDILQHCFAFLTEILYEVREACSKIEKWFNNCLADVLIAGRRIFRDSSGSHILEITDEVDRFLDDMQLLEPSVRDDEARNIITAVNGVANEVDCRTKAEYLKIVEFVCDRLRSSCRTEFTVHRIGGSVGYLTDKEKCELFGGILSQLEASSDRKEIVENFLNDRSYFSEIGKNLILGKPVYQTQKNSVHYFETSTRNVEFDQFVYDAACELLGLNDLFGAGFEFHLHRSEMVLWVTNGEKSLIFNYDIERRDDRVKGIVILDE